MLRISTVLIALVALASLYGGERALGQEAVHVAIIESEHASPELVRALEDALLVNLQVVEGAEGTSAVVLQVEDRAIRILFRGEVLRAEFDSETPLALIALRTSAMLEDFDIPLRSAEEPAVVRESSEVSAAAASEAAMSEATESSDATEAESARAAEQEEGAAENQVLMNAAPPLQPRRDGLWVGGEVQLGVGVGAQVYIGGWVQPRLRLASVLAIIIPFSPSVVPLIGAELAYVTPRLRARFEVGPTLLLGVSRDTADSRAQFNLLAGAFLGLGRQLSERVVLTGRLRFSLFFARDFGGPSQLGAFGALTLGFEWSR